MRKFADWILAKDVTDMVIRHGIDKGLYKLEDGETVADAIAKSNAIVSTWTKVASGRGFIIGLCGGTLITTLAVIYGLCKKAELEKKHTEE